MRSIHWLLALPIFLALFAPEARAQGQYEARSELFARAEGDLVRVAIRTRIAPGWHLYHGPTPADLGDGGGIGTETVVTVSGEGIEWSPVRYPEPHKLPQPLPDAPDTWIYGHDGTIVFYALGRSASGEAIDPASVSARITGLTCEDSGVCIPGEEELENPGKGPDALFTAFPADLAAGGDGSGSGTESGTPDASDAAGTGGASVERSSGAEGEAAGADSTDWAAVTFADYEPHRDAVERSLGVWLFFAFIAGILLNVMPCVLPVVSIKVLSFVQQAGESKGRVFALGLAFGGGILVVFVALASLAAFAQQGWGDQFQSETFKIVMIAIVFAFSLSLFDVFEIGVPSQVGQLASMRREGMGDAFFKGMMATVLATPCSGPFLGSTLTWAVSQPKAIIFAVFMAVGLGMAAPYVLLTSNPALLKYVPKPGAWMQTFKNLMGFLLLATVIFLMVSVRQDLLLFTVTFLIFVGMACWQWGRYAKLGQPLGKRLATGMLTLAIVAVGLRFSFVDFRSLFQEPEAGRVAAASECHVDWEPFVPEVLERYHAEGRAVMVDFTADWCFNCKLNEKWVYESREVCTKLREKNVAVIKADMTNKSPRTEAIERLRTELGASSIPFMAIFPGDDWRRPHVFYDIVTKAEVLAVLEELPDPAPVLGAR